MSLEPLTFKSKVVFQDDVKTKNLQADAVKSKTIEIEQEITNQKELLAKAGEQTITLIDAEGRTKLKDLQSAKASFLKNYSEQNFVKEITFEDGSLYETYATTTVLSSENNNNTFIISIDPDPGYAEQGYHRGYCNIELIDDNLIGMQADTISYNVTVEYEVQGGSVIIAAPTPTVLSSRTEPNKKIIRFSISFQDKGAPDDCNVWINGTINIKWIPETPPYEGLINLTGILNYINERLHVHEKEEITINIPHASSTGTAGQMVIKRYGSIYNFLSKNLSATCATEWIVKKAEYNNFFNNFAGGYCIPIYKGLIDSTNTDNFVSLVAGRMQITVENENITFTIVDVPTGETYESYKISFNQTVID